MKKVLEVKQLTKQFGETRVLKNIDLSVNKGEFVVIMGQSGSGKSTLLHLLSGMDQTTSGSVIVSGEDISQADESYMSQFRLNRMGFIFQQSYLLKNLTIRDNIILPGFKSAKVSREEVNQRADAIMAKVGIENVAANDIKKVSGGQLQRAAICRALINEPEILFADEPTGALNSRATQEILDILTSINKEGTTIVLVTHDTKVASRADRIVYVVDGRVNDQLELSAYETNQDLIKRDKIISSWLEERGF